MSYYNIRFYLFFLSASILAISCGEGDIELVSPSGGYQEFKLDNGSSVKLGPKSKANYKSSAEEFNLEGEAILRVAPGRTLTAHTPNGSVTAHSGEYRIHSRRTTMNVFVINGKANTTNVDGTAPLELKDGTYAIYNGKNIANTDQRPIEQMTNDKYWVFNSASILFILESISAQYGVNFDQGDATLNKVFSGFVPRDDLQIALSIVTRSLGLEYQEDGSNYTLSNAAY